MKKYKSNSQKYSADCSKCGMLHTGSQYYFQKDIKEKCFCGADLINFRYAGEKFDAEADRIARELLANAANWHKQIVNQIPE